MNSKFHSLHKITALIIDGLFLNLSAYCALLLRFDGNIPSQYIQVYYHLAPLITLVGLICMLLFKLYNRMWQYASIGELVAIVKATTCSQLTLFLIITVLQLPGLPKSIYILSWVASNIFIGISRLWWRLFPSYHFHETSNSQRALIVGAGNAGAMVVREIQNNPDIKLNAVAFIDDDPQKIDRIMLGIPIVGSRQDIPDFVKSLKISEIIIAMPSAGRVIVREIVEISKPSGANIKILPNIYYSIRSANVMAHVRNIQMEDLLGRDPVAIDLEQVAGYIHNKVVLITGAGGSIGSELCRQIIDFKPKMLITLDCCENNLFDIENELNDCNSGVKIVGELLDVKHFDSIEKVFIKHKPQVVFHAAAYKHVPMMERHPEEAFYNNVLGTKNVAELSNKYRAETFVLISTDKAVNPTSVMGATKRIAELIIKDINRNSTTRFAAVRFGNVLGSKGSVIPTFKKQIERGGPVTVTHPEMKRFFMTIPEAVELVMQAGALTKGGEIFVLDMGEPVNITDMAKDLIRLYGYEPGKDIEIKFTGIRPGEKLYEELFLDREEMLFTKHQRIFISRKELDENYTGINASIYDLFKGTDPENSELIKLIASLIPEYNPNRTPSATSPDRTAEIVYMQEALKERKVSG